MDQLLREHRWRSDRGIKHAVDDFLFEYYSYRPYQLRRWHPGAGVRLEDAEEFLSLRDYVADTDGVRLDHRAVLEHRLPTVRRNHRLLAATATRRPALGCFGMHEWAMVYGLEPAQTRHPYLGLRLPPDEIAETVRSVGLRCTHIDAFRFFTPPAKPLNAYAPTRERQTEQDQPGCLHVGMDLYKIAYKMAPLIPSELVVDCFRHARRIRELDMRASPYDVSGYGLEPVRVETASGRAEYAEAQRRLAEAGTPLRARLLEWAGRLLDLADRPEG